MGIIDISLRARRAQRRIATAHLYAVGQVVRMRQAGPRTSRTAEVFRITATLPADDGGPQYRLRNTTEKFERVVAQATIEPFTPSPSAAPVALAETVFGGTGGATPEPDAARD